MAEGRRLERPWFESPFFERELEESDLDPESRELVRSYARDGHAVIDLRSAEFNRIATGIDQALRGRHASTNRIQDAWRYVPEVRELASSEVVKRTLRTLYGRRPIPFQTLNFRRGTEQRTHSDVVHFDSMPQRFMAGVWIALEDIGPDSGPLHYYPGSHRLAEYLPHEVCLSGSGTVAARYQEYEDFLTRLLDSSGLRKEVVRPRKGEAFIWAANTLHGGEPIADPDSTRFSQVTHYYFEGCRYWTPLASDPPIGRISWRRVVNVETGEVEPHRYLGRRVRLPWPAALRGALLNRPGAPGRIPHWAMSLLARLDHRSRSWGR